MRTHCTTVAAQSEDKEPVADLNRTRPGEWEGSVSLALPPQAFAPVFAAARCDTAGTGRRRGALRQLGWHAACWRACVRAGLRDRGEYRDDRAQGGEPW